MDVLEVSHPLVRGFCDKHLQVSCPIQGCSLDIQAGNKPEFGDLSSSPAAIESAKAVDAMGAILRKRVQAADASRASWEPPNLGRATRVLAPSLERQACPSLWTSQQVVLPGGSVGAPFMDTRRPAVTGVSTVWGISLGGLRPGQRLEVVLLPQETRVFLLCMLTTSKCLVRRAHSQRPGGSSGRESKPTSPRRCPNT